jgi:hypothetical protein
MFDKYKGEWRFHFVTISASGGITITEQDGKYDFPAIDGNGKITGGKDNDNKELEGNFSKQGPLDVIRLKRKDGARHFRGIKAVERVVSGGIRQLVLVGQRSRNPISEELVEGAEEKVVNPLDQQEEGVWIATKP